MECCYQPTPNCQRRPLLLHGDFALMCGEDYSYFQRNNSTFQLHLWSQQRLCLHWHFKERNYWSLRCIFYVPTIPATFVRYEQVLHRPKQGLHCLRLYRQCQDSIRHHELILLCSYQPSWYRRNWNCYQRSHWNRIYLIGRYLDQQSSSWKPRYSSIRLWYASSWGLRSHCRFDWSGHDSYVNLNVDRLLL